MFKDVQGKIERFNCGTGDSRMAATMAGVGGFDFGRARFGLCNARPLGLYPHDSFQEHRRVLLGL